MNTIGRIFAVAVINNLGWSSCSASADEHPEHSFAQSYAQMNQFLMNQFLPQLKEASIKIICSDEDFITCLAGNTTDLQGRDCNELVTPYADQCYVTYEDEYRQILERLKQADPSASTAAITFPGRKLLPCIQEQLLLAQGKDSDSVYACSQKRIEQKRKDKELLQQKKQEAVTRACPRINKNKDLLDILATVPQKKRNTVFFVVAKWAVNSEDEFQKTVLDSGILKAKSALDCYSADVTTDYDILKTLGVMGPPAAVIYEGSGEIKRFDGSEYKDKVFLWIRSINSRSP